VYVYIYIHTHGGSVNENINTHTHTYSHTHNAEHTVTFIIIHVTLIRYIGLSAHIVYLTIGRAGRVRIESFPLPPSRSACDWFGIASTPRLSRCLSIQPSWNPKRSEECIINTPLDPLHYHKPPPHTHTQNVLTTRCCILLWIQNIWEYTL